MKKTYVTTMPDHIGAFLKASRCFADLGINITRVSYNKAVDSHTLFIDAEGSREQLAEADRQLTRIGYLQNNQTDRSVVLLESEGKRYLLGVGGQSFALLDKADAPKEEEPEQSAARERSAAGTFRDVMAVWKRQENGENAPEE